MLYKHTIFKFSLVCIPTVECCESSVQSLLCMYFVHVSFRFYTARHIQSIAFDHKEHSLTIKKQTYTEENQNCLLFLLPKIAVVHLYQEKTLVCLLSIENKRLVDFVTDGESKYLRYSENASYIFKARQIIHTFTRKQFCFV